MGSRRAESGLAALACVFVLGALPGEAQAQAPAGVVIALDRMERGKGTLSAVQEVKENFGIPVIAVATLEDLIGYLADSPELAANLDAVKAYREQYGISAR